MPQTVTFDERQSDPRPALDSNIGEFVTSAQGDSARGQRRDIAAHTNGDFAAGMRNLSTPRVVGDFATGMRTLARTTTLGDFASGMRTLPRITTLGDFATGMRASSAPVVSNASRSAVSVLSMPPEVMVA
jgi:hypothetical protein